jgi:hypothetical protein
MATPALSANPGSGGSRERAVPGSGSESGGILAFPATSATARSRYEFAQPDPTHRVTMASLWLSSCACQTAAPGLERKSQTHSAADAGGQPAVFATAKVSSPGLVHHSDRGVQYASRDYTALLQQHGIRISMSRLATPYDNAQADSFIKTLKYEEVYRTEYRDLEEAKPLIGKFLEKIYNRQRLHSALGYRPRLEFERSLRPLPAAGKGRFWRHEENLSIRCRTRRSEERQRLSPLPALIGCDEFPVGLDRIWLRLWDKVLRIVLRIEAAQSPLHPIGS